MPKNVAKPKRVRVEAPIVLGPVVAQREYSLGKKKIVLQVGTPRRDGENAYCPVCIVRDGKPRLHRAYGVDSVQALMLAFDLAKTLLEQISSKLEWDAGQAPGDIGIYRRITLGFDRDLDRRLERMIDTVLRERLRELESRHKARQRTKG